jgi:hypothetical protein
MLRDMGTFASTLALKKMGRRSQTNLSLAELILNRWGIIDRFFKAVYIPKIPANKWPGW